MGDSSPRCTIGPFENVYAFSKHSLRHQAKFATILDGLENGICSCRQLGVIAHQVPKILSSDAYTNNGALFVAWDEGNGFISDGPLGLILLSPLARGGGYRNSVFYTHSSILRTLQEIFAVGPLLGDAANATDLSDLFVDYDLKVSAVWNPASARPELTLTGLTAGNTNVIQTSSNLFDWVALSTNVAVANAFRFLETTDSAGAPRFYRVLEFR